MPRVEWTMGSPIDGPVYLDANVLVGYAVQGHRLYKHCTEFIGEILAANTTILVSLLTVQESFWAIARLSYYELAHQPTSAHWSQSIYNRWLERIFSIHGARITVVGSILRAWSEAGVPIEIVPKDEPYFWEVLDQTPEFMRDFRLTPADATHFALARIHAHTFATADRELARITANVDNHPLILMDLSRG